MVGVWVGLVEGVFKSVGNFGWMGIGDFVFLGDLGVGEVEGRVVLVEGILEG